MKNAKMKVSWCLALAVFLGGSAHAVTLQPIPSPQDDLIPIPRNSPPIPCAQMQQELERYHQVARQHDQSLLVFLGQVSERLKDWHAVLKPLETTSQNLERDTFLPLKDGAEKVAQISNMAFDNSEILAKAMDNLIGSLANCTLTDK
jgi:hypothetical protein